MPTGEHKQRGPGVTKQNNKAVVFDLLCKMSQPISITTASIGIILKRERDLDLTYDQLSDIIVALDNDGKIQRKKVGYITQISTIFEFEKMAFAKQLEHKKHNTPPSAWKFVRYISNYCMGYINRISMEELATQIFYDPYKPEKFNKENAERKVRDIQLEIKRGNYVMKNGMPFNIIIISDTRGNGLGGYYGASNLEEVDSYLKRVKLEKLAGWNEYWNLVETASNINQLKYVASKHEKAINRVIHENNIKE
jgi:predicted nucleic acid-binding protein